MKLGYARVSTPEQSNAGQVTTLYEAGCEKVFADTASGAKEKRVQLDKLLEQLREGDVLTVVRLDRLGRSLRHLLELLKTLDERGAHFHSLTEGLDTSTAGGRMIYSVIGALAEFEHSLISERTKEGLAAAKRKGRKGGRPFIDSETLEKIAAMKDSSWTVKDICQMLGIGKTTFYKYVKILEGKSKGEAA